MTSVELPDINQFSNVRVKQDSTSLRKLEQIKFTKLATLKSVDKLIKSNDLSSVIGQNNYYPKQLEDQKPIDEAQEVHMNLNQLKRSCDDLKRKAQIKQKEIEKMRKDIEQMSRTEEGFTESVDQLQSRAKILEVQFRETKQRQLDAMMTKKTYDHMLSRMKKDRLIHQLRANTFEVDLNKNKVLLSCRAQNTQKVQEDNQKATIALQDVIEGIEQQNQNRETNLQRFKDDLKNKQDIEFKREDRIKRQNEIAETAANDARDQNLKKWRKLLMVHKFLNQFLKLKMQREIKKFQGAEQAFQKIKAATGINDANEIVRKFLGREQTYSHLLISIAEYEKRIDSLKQQTEELTNRFSKIKDEKIEREPPKKGSDQNAEQEKLLAEFDEKALQSNLLTTKLTLWIERNLMKLQRGTDQRLPTEGNKEGFIYILNLVNTQLLSLTEDEQYQLIDNQLKSQKEEIYEQEFLKRNIRVKAIKVPKKIHTSISDRQVNDSREGDLNDFDSEDEPVDEQGIPLANINQVIESGLNEKKHLKQMRDEIQAKKKK